MYDRGFVLLEGCWKFCGAKRRKILRKQKRAGDMFVDMSRSARQRFYDANNLPSRLNASRKIRLVSFKRFFTLTLFTSIALAMPLKLRMTRAFRLRFSRAWHAPLE